MGLIFLICGSLVGAYSLVCFEKLFHSMFLQECLEGGVKKQNMDRFVRGVIDSLVNVSPKQAIVTLRMYKHMFSLQKNDKKYLRASVNSPI